MAWERRNNRTYYYESYRDRDGRVRKRYFKTGEVAAKAAAAAARRRQEREQMTQLVARIGALQELNELISEATTFLVKLELYRRGFTCHKGEWRRKRASR